MRQFSVGPGRSTVTAQGPRMAPWHETGDSETVETDPANGIVVHPMIACPVRSGALRVPDNKRLGHNADSRDYLTKRLRR